jgi:hypothetical protein
MNSIRCVSVKVREAYSMKAPFELSVITYSISNYFSYRKKTPFLSPCSKSTLQVNVVNTLTSFGCYRGHGLLSIDL